MQAFMSMLDFGSWRNRQKRRVTVGICAMDKKSKSKPMKEILDRLRAKNLFDISIFGDECILNQPIESWPVVEVLIAFYSTRFPTEKAMEYVRLRKPFMVNDLEMEAVLKDRRKVYKLLESMGIDVPFHVFLERDDLQKENDLQEYDEVQ
jgi:inositol hexakisphosphate/diphosphoinositol-pentakisphosphate kinase